MLRLQLASMPTVALATSGIMIDNLEILWNLEIWKSGKLVRKKVVKLVLKINLIPDRQVFLLLRIACQATLWSNISHNRRNNQVRKQNQWWILLNFACFMYSLLHDWTCKEKFINLQRNPQNKTYPNTKNKSEIYKFQPYVFNEFWWRTSPPILGS